MDASERLSIGGFDSYTLAPDTAIEARGTDPVEFSAPMPESYVGNPSNPSPRIVVAPRQPNWQGCQAAADARKFPIFTFWQNPGAKPGANGTCWLSNNWTKVNPHGSQVRGEEWR